MKRGGRTGLPDDKRGMKAGWTRSGRGGLGGLLQGERKAREEWRASMMEVWGWQAGSLTGSENDKTFSIHDKGKRSSARG